MSYKQRFASDFENYFVGSINPPCGNIGQNHRFIAKTEKYLGFFLKSTDKFIKGTNKGVVNMRERVNYKGQIKKNSIDKNFWEEFINWVLLIDKNNDGSFHEEVKQAKFHKKNANTYEVCFDGKTKFNIVSGKDFMKTVSQIEGLVKYKLFK